MKDTSETEQASGLEDHEAERKANRAAFEAEREELLRDFRGCYVAYLNGRRICKPQKSQEALHEAVRDIVEGKSYFAPKIQTKEEAEASQYGVLRGRG